MVTGGVHRHLLVYLSIKCGRPTPIYELPADHIIKGTHFGWGITYVQRRETPLSLSTHHTQLNTKILACYRVMKFSCSVYQHQKSCSGLLTPEINENEMLLYRYQSLVQSLTYVCQVYYQYYVNSFSLSLYMLHNHLQCLLSKVIFMLYPVFSAVPSSVYLFHNWLLH